MFGLLGGLISGAAALMGGRRSEKSNAKQHAAELASQKEFAQHGIRWRVEDAKAAGLHPLSALGATGASYSPMAISDPSGPALAEAGQHIGRAVAATSTAEEKQLQSLAIQEAISRIGETDARRDYYLSEAARNAQSVSPGIPHESMHTQEMGTPAPDAAGPTPEYAKAIIPQVGDKAMAEGPTPLWREFHLADDMPIALPGGMQGDAAEVLESLAESWPMLWMVYRESVNRYGEEWGKKFLQRYGPQVNFEILPKRPPPRNESIRGRYRDHKKFRDNYVPYEGY